jgi:hypothetical protein
MIELKALVKESVSLVSTATAKDNVLEMWINAAKKDMKRLGIAVDAKIEDELVRSTIVLFVKSNFGNTDPKEKESCHELYKIHLAELSNSPEYKEVQTSV